MRVTGAMLLALLSTFMQLGRASAAECESGTGPDSSAGPPALPEDVLPAVDALPTSTADGCHLVAYPPADVVSAEPVESVTPADPAASPIVAPSAEESVPDAQPSAEPTTPIPDVEATTEPVAEPQPVAEPTEPVDEGEALTEPTEPVAEEPALTEPVDEGEAPAEPTEPVAEEPALTEPADEGEAPAEPTQPVAEEPAPTDPVGTAAVPQAAEEPSAAPSAAASIGAASRSDAPPPSARQAPQAPASVPNPPSVASTGEEPESRPAQSAPPGPVAPVPDPSALPTRLEHLVQFEEPAIAVSASVVAFAAPRVPSQVTVAVVFAKAGSGWAGAIVFNVWLRRQLRERRISQRQLAHMSGVDHSTISRLIGGGRTPSLETATKIAVALRVPEEDIGRELGFTRERPPIPLQRVESALRGDDELDEGDIRALMDAYLARRRRHHLRAVGNDGASRPPPMDSNGDSPA